MLQQNVYQEQKSLARVKLLGRMYSFEFKMSLEAENIKGTTITPARATLTSKSMGRCLQKAILSIMIAMPSRFTNYTCAKY